MLYPQDIIDALAVLVGEKFPGEQVYLDQLPNGFQRPSNYISLGKFTGDAQFTPSLVALHPVVVLTTFAEADPYGISIQRELNRRQMLLTGLLLPGFLRVADRAPKVEKLELEGGVDFATVTVQFAYTLDRTDFLALEEAPVMEHIEVNYHEKKTGKE